MNDDDGDEDDIGVVVGSAQVILTYCVCVPPPLLFFDIHPRTKWWKLWTTIGPGYSFFRGDGGDIFICLICMCLSDFNLMNFFISWFGDPVVGCVCVCHVHMFRCRPDFFFLFLFSLLMIKIWLLLLLLAD